jgi:hypothetical protein
LRCPLAAQTAVNQPDLAGRAENEPDEETQQDQATGWQPGDLLEFLETADKGSNPSRSAIQSVEILDQ